MSDTRNRSEIVIALEAARTALNTAPRFKINHDRFRDSYEVAALLDFILGYDLDYMLDGILMDSESPEPDVDEDPNHHAMPEDDPGHWHTGLL